MGRPIALFLCCLIAPSLLPAADETDVLDRARAAYASLDGVREIRFQAAADWNALYAAMHVDATKDSLAPYLKQAGFEVAFSLDGSPKVSVSRRIPLFRKSSAEGSRPPCRARSRC